MKADRKLLLQIAGAVLVVWTIAAWPLVGNASEEIIAGAVTGTILSVIYAVSGSLMLGYTIGKPETTFVKVALGGMVIRMFVVLGTMFVLITVFGIHAMAMTIALLAFYAMFLTMEIFSIQRQVDMNQEGVKS